MPRCWFFGVLLLVGGCGNEIAKEREFADGSGGTSDDASEGDNQPTRGPVLNDDDELEPWACLNKNTLPTVRYIGITSLANGSGGMP